MENNILDFVEYKIRMEEKRANDLKSAAFDVNSEVQNIINSLESYISAYEKVMGAK